MHAQPEMAEYTSENIHQAMLHWQTVEKKVSWDAGGEVGADAEAAKGSNEGKVGGFKDIMGGSTGGISDLKGAACHCAERQTDLPP